MALVSVIIVSALFALGLPLVSAVVGMSLVALVSVIIVSDASLVPEERSQHVLGVPALTPATALRAGAAVGVAVNEALSDSPLHP